MDKQTRQIREAYWRDIVLEASRQEKGTKHEWCEKSGISERALFYWQRKFRNQAAKQMLIAENDQSECIAVTQDSPKFVELASSVENAAQMQTSDTTDHDDFQSSIMLQTGNVRMFIANNVSEAVLTTVLKAVHNAS